jgi:gamma-tubulin complex component 3
VCIEYFTPRDANANFNTSLMSAVHGLITELINNLVDGKRFDLNHLIDSSIHLLGENNLPESQFSLEYLVDSLSQNISIESVARFRHIVERLEAIIGERHLVSILQFLSASIMSDGSKHRMVNVPSGFQRNDDIYEEEEDFPGFAPGEFIRMIHEPQNPSEDELLQELPYALQGVKTADFRWLGSDDTIQLEQPSSVPFPVMGLLNQILEPALLYKRLKKIEKQAVGGLIRQALFSSINHELQSYLSLVAVLENEVKRPENLTLRRCLALLHDATLGLRLLYTIYEESNELSGGQIISLLHSYTYDGDKFVSRFANRFEEKLCEPFYQILNHWITSGTLMGSADDFFVGIGDAKSAWKGRFIFDSSKVPSFMSPKIAELVFETGKTLYFIRAACQDHEWIDLRRASTQPITDYENLETGISAAYAEVVERLNVILQQQFKLTVHLKGLKDYLLLGKGDFVQLLIEEAAKTLDQPAGSLLRHRLTSMLETAIRGSNAQYDSPEVLDSIDARMLELGHGEIGWDVFTLDYRVQKPLDIVVLNQGSMTEYLRVFNFLWRLKRVNFSLYLGWKRTVLGHRSQLGREIIGQNLGAEWGVVHRVCQEMMHFISELQYYINYDVIEMSWSMLQNELLQGGQLNGKLTVDGIISAHKDYLRQITLKGLLGGEPLMGDLHDILKLMLSFRSSLDAMYQLTISKAADNTEDKKRFDLVYARIQEIKLKFESKVSILVKQLSQQDDSEMRFLGVRLDFNEFYSRHGQKQT